MYKIKMSSCLFLYSLFKDSKEHSDNVITRSIIMRFNGKCEKTLSFVDHDKNITKMILREVVVVNDAVSFGKDNKRIAILKSSLSPNDITNIPIGFSVTSTSNPDIVIQEPNITGNLSFNLILSDDPKRNEVLIKDIDLTISLLFDLYII